MKQVLKKARLLAWMMCAVLIVNMNTSILPIYATGEQEHSVQESAVSIDANGGYFTYAHLSQSYDTEMYEDSVEFGYSLADRGISITDPVSYDMASVFENWMIQEYQVETDEEGNEIGGFYQTIGTYTTEEMLNYKFNAPQTIIIAQYQTIPLVMVEIIGNGGSFTGTFNGEDFDATDYSCLFRCLSSLSEFGFMINDPVNLSEGATFINWLVEVETASGEFVEMGEISTEDLLAYKLVENTTRFTAQYDMAQTVQVCIDCNGASANITCAGESHVTSEHYMTCMVGSTLAASGLTIEDPVPWDAAAEFVNWSVEVEDESGNYVKIGECTTEEMLAYTIPDANIRFVAQTQLVPASTVEFNGNDGTFSVTYNGNVQSGVHWTGTLPIGKKIGDYITEITAPVFWESSRVFEGWMVCMSRLQMSMVVLTGIMYRYRELES